MLQKKPQFTTPNFKGPYVIRLLFSLLVASLLCLKSDSVQGQSDTTISVQSYLVPATLMTAGLILNQNSIKTSFQEKVRDRYPNFTNSADDYFQLLPSALDFFISVTDQKENDLKHLSDMLISELAMVATTQLLKRTINSARPNGGSHAFPSGHTAQAFTGATVLFHHYGKEKPLLAASGFVVASATGAFRVLRDKHWVSDVTFGAGLGILIGTLTYQLNPIGKDKMSEHVQIAAYPGGISLNISF